MYENAAELLLSLLKGNDNTTNTKSDAHYIGTILRYFKFLYIVFMLLFFFRPSLYIDV